MEAEIAEIVREYGWFAADIYDHSPPFVYSVGLMQTCDHPELIIFGLEPGDAHGILSNMFHAIRNGESFRETCTYVGILTGHRSVGIRPVDPSQHPLYLGLAMGYCRFIGRIGELMAVQVFWPDQIGKFPFEVGCDLEVYRRQPRLDLALTPSEIAEFEREFQ